MIRCIQLDILLYAPVKGIASIMEESQHVHTSSVMVEITEVGISVMQNTGHLSSPSSMASRGESENGDIAEIGLKSY